MSKAVQYKTGIYCVLKQCYYDENTGPFSLISFDKLVIAENLRKNGNELKLKL